MTNNTLAARVQALYDALSLINGHESIIAQVALRDKTLVADVAALESKETWVEKGWREYQSKQSFDSALKQVLERVEAIHKHSHTRGTSGDLIDGLALEAIALIKPMVGAK